jgi:release factor glutamine methyltransferase
MNAAPPAGPAPDAVPGSIAQALADARTRGLARLDALAMLEHLCGRPRVWLLTHDDEPLPPGAAAQWPRWLARRVAGEPLAYLVGHKEFHGLDLRVGPEVLVPRPDTETLVAWALERLPPSGRVIDLGTGSGAIALAIAAARPDARVAARELSPAALAVARGNGERLGLPVSWSAGSWLEDLPAGTGPFELIVSNPPYIAGDDPHLPALRHEPRLALTPEGDGLDALRAITAQAGAHLVPGGWLLFEHGHDQADAVAGLLARAGFEAIGHRHDLAGIARCTGGRWPGR